MFFKHQQVKSLRQALQQNPAYKDVHNQCLIQLGKDVIVPLQELTDSKKRPAEQMDLPRTVSF